MIVETTQLNSLGTTYGGSMSENNEASLGDVIDRLIKAKKAANRRSTYIRALRLYLQMFARGREMEPIISINRQQVEDWFDSRTESPVTKRTGMQRLSVLFQHAIRLGYREGNPIEKMDKVSVDLQPPRVLTPKEARQILLYAKRKMRWRLPHIVLGLMAGVRPAEMARLRWENINLERGYVTIDAAAAKTRQRRIVHLDPKAVAWLKWSKAHGARLSQPVGSLSSKWKKLVEKNCGIQWQMDILRHSAASYLLEKYQDPGKIARMLGNSQDVLLQRYIQLISPEDCRRFWRWNPNFLRGKAMALRPPS